MFTLRTAFHVEWGLGLSVFWSRTSTTVSFGPQHLATAVVVLGCPQLHDMQEEPKTGNYVYA